MFRPKDFVETPEGLVFAVVSSMMESGRVLCFLRYVLKAEGWSKVSTGQANDILRRDYPQYLYHSTRLDAYLHAVPSRKVVTHHQPQRRLEALLEEHAENAVVKDLQQLCQWLSHEGIALKEMGITGSLLIGAQNAESDIDLLVYGRDCFQQVRSIFSELIRQGLCQPLTETAWSESYRRRGCDLNLSEYIWHEQRKLNKLMIHQRKIDLSLIVEERGQEETVYGKHGRLVIRTRVIDDFYGFDYPAVFSIDHEEIQTVVCFTATYTGQARAGEWIEVAGQLEVSIQGDRRIIVGSTREAHGEYIKVLIDERADA